ncbi:anthranilate synthase component I family protein [Microbacterium oleivorans]|uniref:anthranilate synthase component I family protein n=1 Tax=Microbacterium TaxID=33882 RepID=UPI00203AB294|nr:anthranilate synthase component I family protein [Microbacterium oleivorans]MCM3696548.1 anthranilate synthase component I family protein [Microbacterium oleivorans]
MSSDLASRTLAGWVDPAVVFLGLFAPADDVFWLDAGPDASEGWSWVGSGIRSSAPRDVVAAGGGDRSAGPFRGGWVGWAGYDDAAARAGSPASVDQGPGELWLRVERMLGFDHAARRVVVFAAQEQLTAFMDEIEATEWRATSVPDPAPSVAVTARHEPSEYAALIEQCREEIREGRAYQLCLTTRFETSASVDPVRAYLRLRAATPAHHGGFIRSGGWALASASPEQFLAVEDGIVRTRPIKGTRPRSADPPRDAALAAELRGSEKEQAENVMIVDLMRNDLQRVCDAGSVAAERLLDVESYPAVHQLVSTVAGRLRAGTTVGELWEAAFPAGSMTGAPKLSAMQILHRLEGAPRGVFAGCFGWVGDDGGLDLAMVIRSIVVHPQGAYVGAGGGITWGSVAADEVAEVGIKARAPLAALGAELPPGW